MNFHSHSFTVLAAIVLAAVAVEQLTAQDEEADRRNVLPSATEVLERYIDAIGSEMVLLGADSMNLKLKIETSSTLTPVDDGKLSLSWSSDNNWAFENVMIANKARSGMKDGRMWRKSGTTGAQWISEKEAAESLAMLEHLFPNAALKWLDDVKANQTIEKTKIEGRIAWELESDDASGGTVRSFDAETGLLVRIESRNSGMKCSQTLSDYREVDGMMLPHKTSINYGQIGLSMQLTLESVDYNSPVDQKLLALPDDIAEPQDNADDRHETSDEDKR